MHFGAEFHADATPALKLVGARWAFSHAAPLMIVMHAGSTGCITPRECAAAQALGVAALTIHRAISLSTLLWALWRKHRRQNYTWAYKNISLLLYVQLIDREPP